MAVAGMVWGDESVLAWEFARLANDLDGIVSQITLSLERCTTWRAPSRDRLAGRLMSHENTLSYDASRLRAIAAQMHGTPPLTLSSFPHVDYQ